ncbi:hypothetical protein MMC24_007252 [Lignoscripta atroalba]|nr:hypothetical protein [Lignoscripta atroalba]
MRSSSPQTLLSQRWLFISGEISSRQLSRDSVVALNRSLDEVENLLSWNAPGILWHKTAHFGLGITERSPADSPMILPETTPPDSTRAYAPDVVERPGSRIKESGDDQALLQRIASAVEQLRRRQEEFKHLHNVTIAKAEESAERTMQLETEIDQLEADVIDDQSELTYLKLKLRILELQALPYVPTKEKDSLAEGIQRWKLDWAEVESRFRTRRRKRDPGKIYALGTGSNIGHIYDTVNYH